MFSIKFLIAGLAALVTSTPGHLQVYFPEVDSAHFAQRGLMVPGHEPELWILREDLPQLNDDTGCRGVGGRDQPMPDGEDACAWSLSGATLTIDGAVYGGASANLGKIAEMSTVSPGSDVIKADQALAFVDLPLTTADSISTCATASEYTMFSEQLECSYDFQRIGFATSGAGTPLATAALLRYEAAGAFKLLLTHSSGVTEIMAGSDKDKSVEAAVLNVPETTAGQGGSRMFDHHFLAYQELSATKEKILEREIPIRTGVCQIVRPSACDSPFWSHCGQNLHKMITTLSKNPLVMEDDSAVNEAVGALLDGTLAGSCVGPPICPMALFSRVE